ncbi:lysophospholipid acyltransferase family protein [Maritimibacter alexandrii]|uniref:lysophospholipid acyltransferase family protein n=1 Tax=Maritimibacter alexandrii TaxID=2570355 RepID=UPI001108BB0B|nr:lysophospholipid acyltransferase family protein [Maritimibacter alexandrii]
MDQSVNTVARARAARRAASDRSDAAKQGEQYSPEKPALGHTYTKRDLSYADTFDNKVQARLIRWMEMLTGKLMIFHMINKFEKLGAPTGIDFWSGAMKAMGIDVNTPKEQYLNIPKEGPVVVVANHTHGLVDGMVLGDMISRVRPDFQILTRSVLTGLDEVASSFLIPVPFPHDPDAQEKGKEMRAQALERLKSGGVIAVFPSGVVAASETWWGPPVEAEWNLFTAQLIRKTGATVVPIKFHGRNTRAYNIANKVSATMRQGLLIHEIVRACNQPHAPTIGKAITPDEVDEKWTSPREFIKWLREHTLSLKS